MPEFYAATAAKAQALIQKRGRPITLNHVADAVAADPDKPWDTVESPDGPETFDTFGVFIAFDSKDVDGEKVKATDLKLLVSPVGMRSTSPIAIRSRTACTVICQSRMSILSSPVECACSIPSR